MQSSNRRQAMKKYTGIPSAQTRINIFRVRKVYRASQERCRRIGRSLARVILEKATSDRALEEMVDMSDYLGLPPELVKRLYLIKCVPPYRCE
jgi:hypothetical protein